MRKESNSNIGVVLIAAGSSSRLGQPKQLVPFGHQPLILYILDQIQASKASDVLVILGAHLEKIQPVVADKAPIAVNPDWSSGMSTSIRLGVEQLAERCDGLMICVVDQYALTTAYIDLLIDAFDSHTDIIASRYNDDLIGVPAIFHPSQFDQLLQLSGDRGAGKIIKKMHLNNPDAIKVMDFLEGLRDVDTPDDILKMKDYPSS